MDQKDYRKAFDSLSFSDDFQARTTALLQERARKIEKECNVMKNKKKMLTAAVAVAAVTIVSVSAAVLVLSPADVADHAGDSKLAEVFRSGSALEVNQTKSFAEYTVTLEGMASGKGLSTFSDDVQEERTYTVFSIEHTDGSPIDELPELSYSPLVGGYNVSCVNSWTLGGGYTGFRDGGKFYYLFDTESIEMFADHNVYFAIYKGGAPSPSSFSMKEDGTIEMRDGVEGVLFDIPLDKSKADPAAANAFARESGMRYEPITDEEYEKMLEEKASESGEYLTATEEEDGTIIIDPANVK